MIFRSNDEGSNGKKKLVTFKKKENTNTGKTNTFLTLGLTNYLKHPTFMVNSPSYQRRRNASHTAAVAKRAGINNCPLNEVSKFVEPLRTGAAFGGGGAFST